MGNVAAEQLHHEVLVIDGHADTPQRFADDGAEFDGELNGGMLNLASARAGGLAAEFFALWPEPTQWRGRYAHRTLQLLDSVHEQVRRHSDTMMLGRCAEDIVTARQQNRFCALLGVEGGHAIENSLALLRVYYALGVRYMTLTWSNSNEWADSSGDLDDDTVPHHGGLTEFGREVVREMNRLGMMVDVSHVSDATFWDVLRTTHAPVFASHSCARALTDSPRNLTDEMLQAVATSNGLVMVNFYPAFISERWRVAWKASEAERAPLYEAAERQYRERGVPVPYSVPVRVDREFYSKVFSQRQQLPGVDDVLEHIEHIARIAGIDHVGLGSDFDGFALAPRGLETAAGLPKITAGLLARGFTEAQVRKVLGENMLRVMRDTEAVAMRDMVVSMGDASTSASSEVRVARIGVSRVG